MNSRRNLVSRSRPQIFRLGAFASGFTIWNRSTIRATGSTSFSAIKNFTQEVELTNDTLLLAALALIIVGCIQSCSSAFPLLVTRCLSRVTNSICCLYGLRVKAAGFAAILRVLYVTLGEYQADWQPVIYAIAIATLLTGSLLASYKPI
ncbi:MAG: hypothetical protein Ct9H90mP11_01370 [Acidimicrobiales bacterium]|nr:MAG: hypothetical protein Ct9H90mP11_01370 [Acidimicrobiales bacterium]